MSQAQGQLRYRGQCDDCSWTGRPFVRYGTADTAARDHADAHRHTAFVADQYDLRIVGSTVRPGEARQH
ncbi:hypothetical protein [Jiangella alkaliphila]|uniref:Uncharacterized protein n=1 Tax=Jiangella alkaliphila TaxID=419479 RepID=A0A1H2HI47_9ACTN|nr:hypothetical protein [Jiangella alkaliphila]SDU31494.1 hypothetical protein SAMN04488563_1055 [Jiangella alkaliphila]